MAAIGTSTNAVKQLTRSRPIKKSSCLVLGEKMRLMVMFDDVIKMIRKDMIPVLWKISVTIID